MKGIDWNQYRKSCYCKFSGGQLEEALLKESDLLIEQAKSQGEKMIYELFKAAVLQQYKDSYDVEVSLGEVRTETINKYVDYLFSETSAKFRQLPMVDDVTKNDVINFWKENLNVIKNYPAAHIISLAITIAYALNDFSFSTPSEVPSLIKSLFHCLIIYP